MAVTKVASKVAARVGNLAFWMVVTKAASKAVLSVE
jgi:hypothetical protein